PQGFFVLDRDDLFQLHHAHVAALLELAVFIENEGDAARHAGREVPSRLTEHHHDPAGHVLAAVVAGALDDGPRAAVANGEPLARRPIEVALALRRSIQRGVPDQDCLLRYDGRALGRIDDDSPTAQSLAEIIV